MSKGSNSPGISRLAGVLKDIARNEQDTSLLLDFGVVQSDGSLLTNSYPIPIPRSDYLVCRHLKSRTVEATTSSRSVGDHGSHSHTVRISTREALLANPCTDRVYDFSFEWDGDALYTAFTVKPKNWAAFDIALNVV